ncbi:hypothetical protein [Pseudoalteromonas byunsanensis]|uniref:Uncharacterized protein n=1 Tax=Pseudoalteromonas byunsanensis TaxID=327939 RepID=A0A1S1NB99_9GAMM|nr:hypothetical protein [Pseudoalteromonas byunsanensis]OHU97349.1 hypothetical protein BIW53_03235 [Pseudoalteromonas byunsanensis]
MSSQQTHLSDLKQLVDDFQEIINNEQHEKIANLIAQYPQSYELHFLDGSYQAEKGTYEQAKDAFTRCLELKPDYHIARFQLCFLATLNSDVDTFNRFISSLLELTEQVYLSLFANALIHVCNNEIDHAKQMLKEGILLNNENHALNENMTKLLYMISEEPEQETVDDSEADELSSSTNSVLLDIYKNKFN